MAKSKGKKGSVNVQDMGAKKNPKGGYLKVNMDSGATHKIDTALKIDSTLKVTPSALKIK